MSTPCTNQQAATYTTLQLEDGTGSEACADKARMAGQDDSTRGMAWSAEMTRKQHTGHAPRHHSECVLGKRERCKATTQHDARPTRGTEQESLSCKSRTSGMQPGCGMLTRFWSLSMQHPTTHVACACHEHNTPAL